MNSIAQTLIRSLLKTLGGYFIAKGLIDDSQAEVIIAGVVTVIGVIWGIKHRGGPPDDRAGAVPIPIRVLGMLGIIWLMAGCAHFSTSQTDLSYYEGEKPARKITTEYSTTALFDSRIALNAFHATQTDKSQGVTIGALNEDASGAAAATNAGAFLGALIRNAK